MTHSRATRGRWAAAVLAVLGFTVTVMVTAAPAAAHAALAGSTPADGSQIIASPERVSLTFNQDVQQVFYALTVTGPAGTEYTRGEPTVAGRELSVALTPLDTSGTYTVAFRVVSADGHPIQGQYTFEFLPAPSTATAPGSAAPPPPAPTPQPEPAEATPTPQAADPGADDTSMRPYLAAGFAVFFVVLIVVTWRKKII